jgi:hypothetical protein
MPQSRCNRDFLEEATASQRRSDIVPNDLHSDVTIVLDIASKEDARHSTASCFALDLVSAAEHATDMRFIVTP